MSNPYSLDRVNSTAVRMLSRYGSRKKAEEWAFDHGKDYPEGSEQRVYWEAVRAAIKIVQIVNV